MEVFTDPCALRCTHSFCSSCMADWIGTFIAKSTFPKCPLCQTKIDPKNVAKDLLAYNLVSELKVYCVRKDQGC